MAGKHDEQPRDPDVQTTIYICTKYVNIYFPSYFYLPASGHAVVTGVVPSPPRLLISLLIAHRVRQSHCSWIFHRVLLTHALALSASQLVHKKKSPRIYTSMHSGGFEHTKLIYTRLRDNLIRHRGERIIYSTPDTSFEWSIMESLFSFLLSAVSAPRQQITNSPCPRKLVHIMASLD